MLTMMMMMMMMMMLTLTLMCASRYDEDPEKMIIWEAGKGREGRKQEHRKKSERVGAIDR